MLTLIEKISVYIDGKLDKVFDNMLDALSHVHNNCVGHKVAFKTEKEYIYVK